MLAVGRWLLVIGLKICILSATVVMNICVKLINEMRDCLAKLADALGIQAIVGFNPFYRATNQTGIF